MGQNFVAACDIDFRIRGGGLGQLSELGEDDGVPQLLCVDSRAPLAAPVDVPRAEQHADSMAAAVLQERSGGHSAGGWPAGADDVAGGNGGQGMGKTFVDGLCAHSRGGDGVAVSAQAVGDAGGYLLLRQSGGGGLRQP